MAVLFETRAKGRGDQPDAVCLASIDPPTGNRRALIFDSHRDAPKGFGVKVYPSGRRVFVLRYFAEGRDRLMTIGDWPTWSLAAARRQAVEFKRKIDTGTDILEERREQRREPTVKDVWAVFWKGHVEKLRSGGAIRATIERHVLPELGAVKIRDVRRRDVIALIEEDAEAHPRQAALTLGHIKQLFAFAEDREYIDANPVATIKPRKVSRALSPRARGRVLSDAEIASFWNSAETCGIHRITALALKMVLVTGQRPGEVAGMRWEEIEGRLWTIPEGRRGKTGTAQVVPLTDTALDLLERVEAEGRRLSRRRSAKSSVFVFEARAGIPVATSSLGRAVNRYADALGNRDVEVWGHWTPHDLRRTMRTGLSACGVSEIVAELTIGHTRKGIAAVYDLHRYDAEKRAALEAWERRLLRIAAGQPADDNVVPIGAKSPQSANG